jgi:ribonuclease G
VASGLGGATIMVDVNPEVAELLYDEERMGIEYLERKLDRKVVIKAKDGLHQDQFEIMEI